MPPADQRLRAQLRLILGEARDAESEDGHRQADGLEGAAAYPPDWEEKGDVEYLYRERTLLVRTASWQRVQTELNDILPGDVRIELFPVIDGVTRMTWSWPDSNPNLPPLPTTPQVFGGYMRGEVEVPGLDARLGVGTATPDHVLYLSGHPCPAKEPEEMPASAGPFPAQSTGQCCCHDGHSRPLRFCDGDGVHVVILDGGLLEAAPRDRSWLDGVRGDIEDPIENGLIKHYAGHGTFVAGCVRCTAPRASIFVKRAPVTPGELTAGAAYESTVVQKIAEALDDGPDIIVCEYSAETRLDAQLVSFDVLYETRIRPLKGLVIVVPAGNEGRRFPTWPAAHVGVLSVGALSANWRSRASFSNHGGWVDVYAPGEDLVNAFATGDYVCVEEPNEDDQRHFEGMAKWSGTSFSTPLVAGLIAARMSATGENAPRAAEALLQLARSQALPGVGPVLFPDQACCDPGSCRPSDCSCHDKHHGHHGRH